MNELIDKLRGCGQCNDDSCKYLDEDDWYCDKDAIMRDAAAALKAADKRIAELEAQMPKQGKWISDLPNELFVNVNPWKCSVCGKHQHFREDYCPNCGAKMRTVTDCHTLEEGER